MFDYIKARIQDFHRRHGGVCFSDGQFWYYPDGAYRDATHSMGILAEPLDGSTREGEFTNAENILKHYKFKLKVAAEQFRRLDFQLETATPHDPEQALAELKRLQRSVENAKKDVAAAEKKLAATQIARRRKDIKEAEIEQRRRFEEFQKQRRRVRV
jgi:hypothetical protein